MTCSVPMRSAAIASTIALGVFSASVSAHADQELSQAANDPTALLQAHLFQDFYTPNYHKDSGASGNTLQYRGAFPFRLGGVDNLARITVPYVTDSPSGKTGFSDITLFDLAVFNEPWGRWGVGAVASVPTGDRGVGTGQWAIGPAAGFTAASGKLLWGIFNQNLFSVAERFDGPDLNISNIQPIISYGFGEGWSLGSSEMNIIYDWDEGEFTSLPLGLKLGKLVHVNNTPVQLSVQYERNFYDDRIAPRDTVGFIAKVLLP